MHNNALPQLGADGNNLSFTLLLFFSSGWTDLQLAFVVRGKIRSFNEQHHPADTASNAQPAAMPPLCTMPELNSADTAENRQQIIFHLQFSTARLLLSVGQYDSSVIMRNFLLFSIARLNCHLHSCFFIVFVKGTDA